MNYNPKEHHQRSTRLKAYDYSNPNWYYVTICTYDRKHLFGEVKNSKMILNEYGKIVEEEWLKTKKLRKNIDLDYYIIMPNHFHGILIIECRDTACCVPTKANENRRFREMQPGSLSVIMRSFKSAVTKRINDLRKTPSKEVWQKGFYEHIIRNERDLYKIRKYIELNPLQWEIDEYYSDADIS